MKKFITLSIFAFALIFACSRSDAAENAAVNIAPTGEFSIAGLRFQLLYRDAQWNSRMQSAATVRPEAGFPKRSSELFELQGVFNVAPDAAFNLKELIRFRSETQIDYRFSLNSGQAIPANLVALSVNLPMDRALSVNGRPVGFNAEFDPEKWAILHARQETTLEIPLKSGMLILRGTFGFRLQDERKFKLDHWALWLLADPDSGNVTASELALSIRFQPWRSTPLDLRAAANMGFADPVADDGKGGWTDQGPSNDLAEMHGGGFDFSGIRCNVIEPEDNSGRSCLLFGSKDRPGFPAEFTLPGAGNEPVRNLYLLHAAAWEKPEGTPLGEIIAVYEDGSEQRIVLRSGVDVGNFWNPLPRANATPVWTGRNRSARVGLYLAKFSLENKPVRSFTLRSAGNAVWIVVAATVSPDDIPLPEEQSIVLHPDETWHVIDNPGKVKAGTALDFSQPDAVPAGEAGFVEFRDGHFFLPDGSRLRLWGANICQEALFMNDAELAALADDFARYGYNAARFHQFDHRIHRRDRGHSTELETRALDRLDRLAWGVKKRGIHFTIDPYTPRVLPAGELPGFEDAPLGLAEFKQLIYVLPAALENWKEAAANFLNHVNPYTGVAWKEEPALVSISLVNEDTSFAVWNRNSKIAALYEMKFEEYCKARNLPFASENRPLLFREFLNENHRRVYAEMKEFLRSLGVRAALNSQNYWAQVSLGLSRNDYDMVDNHFYWGHPEFLGKDWTLPALISGESAVRTFTGSLGFVAGSRIFGKPFTITEWDHVNPSPFAAEGAVLAGAYAALQDWDGMFRFTYTHSPDRVRNPESPIYLFDIVGDPLRSLSERIGALLFLRTDVAPAKNEFSVRIGRDYQRNAENPEFFPPEFQYGTCISKIGTVVDESHPDAADFPAVPVGEVLTSDTGELTLDQPRGVFSAVTPRSETFILPEKERAAGRFTTVNCVKSWSVTSVAALDERPLAESEHLLLFHLTEAKNSNMRFSDSAMTVVEDWGTTPQLMRRGIAELELKRDFSSYKLYALRFDGTRLEEVPFRVEDNVSCITLDNVRGNHAVAAYELVKVMK